MRNATLCESCETKRKKTLTMRLVTTREERPNVDFKRKGGVFTNREALLMIKKNFLAERLKHLN